MRIIVSFLALILFAGCAGVSKQEVTSAHFAPLPANYQTCIKGYMVTRLKDPYSAVFVFGTPRRGFNMDGLVYGGKKHFGTIVPTMINARNSFGGYVGAQQYYFFFWDDQLADVTDVFGQMANYIDR